MSRPKKRPAAQPDAIELPNRQPAEAVDPAEEGRGPKVIYLSFDESLLPPAEWFDDAPLTPEEEALAVRRHRRLAH